MKRLKVHNYYYLAAAVLSILAALGHAIYTNQLILPQLEVSDLEKLTQDANFMSWHLSTSTSVVSAIGLFIMTIYRKREATIPLVALVAGINAGRYLIFLGMGFFRNGELFQDALANTLFMLVYLGVMILGIRYEGRK
ncbi:MAG: hypothetical protein AAFR87_11735 [Bacteroidota bacterium]